MRKDRAGETNTNYQGLNMEVVRYISSTNMSIKFSDGTIRHDVAYKEFKSGSVKNYMYKHIFGVACVGIGNYVPKVKGKMSKSYVYWFNMLTRCYDPTCNRANTYYGKVTVCELWLNYQNFAKWFDSTFDYSYMEGWHIDKDLLSDGLEYSPNSCCFIPGEINSIFKKNNESLYGYPRGVSKKDNKYQASIHRYGKQGYIGLFNTIEEAHEEYLIAKTEYMRELSIKWRYLLGDKICDSILNFDLNRL